MRSENRFPLFLIPLQSTRRGSFGAARRPKPSRQAGQCGGHARNRTGVNGFAVRCVTTPPRGLVLSAANGHRFLFAVARGHDVTRDIASRLRRNNMKGPRGGANSRRGKDAGRPADCALMPHRRASGLPFERSRINHSDPPGRGAAAGTQGPSWKISRKPVPPWSNPRSGPTT